MAIQRPRARRYEETNSAIRCSSSFYRYIFSSDSCVQANRRLVACLTPLHRNTMEVISTRMQATLTIEGARKLAAAAIDCAREILSKEEDTRLDLNIAICDAGGNLLLFERHGQAKITGIQLVMNKAFTAAGHQANTSLWSSVDAQVLKNLEAANGNRFCSIGGGVPIRGLGGVLLGGIGIGGGSAQQDEAIAIAAVFELLERD
ncbi:hypothetical protein BCR37DRAFT_382433 [Protomyces lactucae-debilis]|uniref:Heme-binding protein n=1 Tax=Protomyces lactucae-debilis TaxID=2754530 RepID=A0A1Y2F2T3_PROLT|nr:uncharacterized protein BCR37DRAFT_382433 [Protomyces lactucae-debilis]ORY78172.1 hypothetical protein BCR37DRAFT_382433 [Protomyces lactucae-debilis]